MRQTQTLLPRLFFALGLSLLLSNCQNDTPANAATSGETSGQNPDRNKGVEIPANLQPAQIEITDLNYWSENQLFTVVGIANDRSGRWARTFLKVTFRDASGQVVMVNDKPESFIPVATGIIPPGGSSAFCWSWDVFAFSSQPAICEVAGAGMREAAPGMILSIKTSSMIDVRTGTKTSPTDTTTATQLVGKQIQCAILNPTEQIADLPLAQALLYGMDKKLWFVALLPADSSSAVAPCNRSGPIMPKEERRVGTGVLFSAMPTGLQKAGVERIDFMPFNARPND